MKLKLTVEFEVENDWDDRLLFARPDGRKRVVEMVLRGTTMLAAMEGARRGYLENHIKVTGVTVSPPTWQGWDNAGIARAMGAVESLVDGAEDALVIEDRT